MDETMEVSTWTRRRFGRVATGLAVVAAGCLVASTPTVEVAAQTPNFDKIAWGDFGSSYLINPDGTNNTRFKVASTGNFDWTPDGEKFIWRSDSGGPDAGNFFIRNQNGAEFPLDIRGSDAEISADGTKIVYTSSVPGLGNVVKVVDVNGEELADLGQGRFGTFSPDGTKVAFEKHGEVSLGCNDPRNPPDTLEYNATGLAVASASGGGSSWVVEPMLNISGGGDGAVYHSYAYDPAWSPDGTQLLFHGSETTVKYSGSKGVFGGCITNVSDVDLYIVGAGGGDPKNLTDDFTWIGGEFAEDPFDGNGSFSPDGKTIAFASARNTPRDGGIHSLWKMDRGGTNPELVLATNRVDRTVWTKALPVGEQVSIKAPDNCATERRETPGTFTIERSGVTDGAVDVTVRVTSSSTATSGSDFPAIPTTVTIPDGTNLANLVVFPTDDDQAEGDETITVEIVDAGGGLLVGEPSTATITIDDDDDDIDGRCAAEPTPDIAPLASPARFLDTRVAGETLDGTSQGGGPVGAGSEIEVVIAGRGAVDGDAQAVALNVTAISPAGRGFVTIHPCGDLPLASSLNFSSSGVVVGNEVIAKLSPEGSLCIFTSSSTHLTADVVGFVPPSSANKSLTPARLLDSRPGGETTDGTSQRDGRVAGGTEIEVPIAGRGGVDEGAQSAILNVTAIGPEGRGFATIHPCGERPVASSLNFSAPGVVVGNEVIAKLSDEGSICIYTSASTHLTADVVGFIPTGASTRSSTPARMLDTRNGQETVDGESAGVGRILAGEVLEVPLAGRPGIPASAVTAVVINVTAINPEARGYVTVHSCGEVPLASSLNFSAPGVVVGNEVIARLSAKGSVCLFSSTGVDLTIDAVGYVGVVVSA